MSRARERREQARMKRQVPDHFPDVGNMVDDTDESEWDDVPEQDEDVQEEQR